jgi:uncharacterized membrane-anchored protein
MSASTVDRLVEAAVADGLLPAGSTAPSRENRPWPVVLLTAFGAWLAALPLTGVLVPLLNAGDGAGLYVTGVIVFGGAVHVLRSRKLPLFFEQLAVPALLTGAGALGFGLFSDLPPQAAAAVLAAVMLAAALLVPVAWLRALLGAALAPLLAIAVTHEPWSAWGRWSAWPYWLAWHLVLAASLAAAWLQHRQGAAGATASRAAALEPLLAGVHLAVFVALAWWSGETLGGASFDGDVRALGDPFGPMVMAVGMQAASAVLAVVAAGWLARAWPSLRHPWCAAVGVVLVVLAWYLPALGAVLLALALCAASQRWRMAGAAGFAAAWMVGAFYHRLDLPLAHKALVLAAAGAALGGLAWWASPRAPRRQAPRSAMSRRAAGGMALTALAMLAVVNLGIRQKEQLIATGQPVLVELAPVDPRSLMQGDYMRLDYRLPEDLRRRLGRTALGARPHVVAHRDARGVATLQRLDDGRALAADELRIELTPKDGRWVLVSDAWFFREGEAARWANAKYGEFRVDAQGSALLVGLRDAALQKL